MSVLRTSVLRIVARRLPSSLVLLLVVSGLTFVLVSLVPGDPARTIAGEHSTEEQYLQIRGELGLDDPVFVQYGRWLSHVVKGDLGTSLFSGEPVTTMLNARLGVSLSLIVTGTLVAGLLGIAVGLWGARRGGPAARLVDVLSLAGLAVPGFWLALVLIAVFAVGLRWFPATGYTAFGEDPAEWARSLVLPVAALALSSVAIVAKQTRDSVLDTLDKDFIRVMQANGFSARSVLYRHVLRNAAIPVVTVLGILFVSLLAAAVFVESVFAMPGLGSATIQATLTHDIPVLQGAVLYITLLVVAVNLLVDLAYGRLDPRVRAS